MTEEEQANDWATADCNGETPMNACQKPEIEEVPECTGGNEVPLDCMPQEFAPEPIQPGIGLRFDENNHMIAIGIITEGGSASIGISLEEAVLFRDNLNLVIAEAEAAVVANKDNVEV